MSFLLSFIDLLQGILKDTNQRLEIVHQSDEPLKQGIWYALDYYRALAEKQKTSAVAKFQRNDLFFHGHANLDFVELVQDRNSPTGFAPLSFKIRRGVRPSSAVQSIQKGLSFLDCSSVILLAAYQALLQSLGESKFDLLFSSSSPFPFHLASSGPSPLELLLEKKLIPSESQIRQGDICYFSNIKEYVAKHPSGESRGDRVICIQETPHLYTGLGLKAEGVDQKEVEYQLWDCYNRTPVEPSCFRAPIWDYLCSHFYRGNIQKGKALVESFQSSTLSWEQFQQKPARAYFLGHPCIGKLGRCVYRFDLGKIQQLIESEEKSVLSTFSSFVQKRPRF